MKTMEPVDEQLYEIAVDIHGIRDGPRLGRLRHVNKVIFSFKLPRDYFWTFELMGYFRKKQIQRNELEDGLLTKHF